MLLAANVNDRCFVQMAQSMRLCPLVKRSMDSLAASDTVKRVQGVPQEAICIAMHEVGSHPSICALVLCCCLADYRPRSLGCWAALHLPQVESYFACISFSRLYFGLW